MPEAIAGDPAAVRAAADRWHRFGDALEAAHDAIGALDVGEWAGAAQQAFAAYQRDTGTVWLAGSDACHAAGTAVAAYADTLEWAQREAGSVTGEDGLDRIRAQVATAGDDAAAEVRAANASAPRTLLEPGETETAWDGVVGSHPDPGKITAEGRRAHILWGDHENPEQSSGGHHHDSGIPGKTVFPEDWDSDKIIDEATDIGRDPDQTPVQQPNGNWRAEGVRDGVRVVVIIDDDGQIVTAYPVAGDGVARNDDEGEPQLLDPPPDGDDETTVDVDEELADAEEADDHAEREDAEAEDHEDRSEEAVDAGDRDAASEHGAAAEESRDEAETSRLVADQHRERAERAQDTDDEASSWWDFRL